MAVHTAADASQPQGCFSQVRDYVTDMALYLRADVNVVDADDVSAVLAEIE